MGQIKGQIGSNGFAPVTVDGASRFIQGGTTQGAVEAIRTAAQEWADAHGAPCHIDVQAGTGRLVETVEPATLPGMTTGPAPQPDAGPDDTKGAEHGDAEVPGDVAGDRPDVPVSAGLRGLESPAPTVDHGDQDQNDGGRDPDGQDAGLGIITDTGPQPGAAPEEDAGDVVSAGMPVVNPFDLDAGSPAGSSPARHRVVVVANNAGGAGKTPTTLGVLSAMADRRPGDVIVVDLNPTGNLGDYVGVGHRAPLTELVEWLRSTPDPSDQQMREHVAYVPELRCSVITSRATVTDGHGNPIPPHISTADAELLFDVLAAHYSVIGVDAGNNDVDYAFRTAIGRATDLLIPVAWTPKTVHGAYQTMRDLWDLGHRELVSGAVVVSTWGARPVRSFERAERARFEQRGLRIADIPADPIIRRRLVAAGVKPKTRQAYRDLAGLLEATP